MRILLCSGTLLYLLILLPYSDQLFPRTPLLSIGHLILRSGVIGLKDSLFTPKFIPTITGFLWASFFPLVCALSNRCTRLAMLGVCFFSLNLFNLCGPISSGGTNLASVLFVYMVFVDTSGRNSTPRNSFGSLIKVTLSNIAYIICLIQIVFVYACAGMYKSTGELWQTGMALYDLQHDTYAHPFTTEFVLNYPFLTSLGTHVASYSSCYFQRSYGFEKHDRSLLRWAVCSHGFGIALGMGLLFFGGLMCLVYGFFIEDQTAEPMVRTLCFQDRFQLIAKPSKGIAATILRWSPGLNWGKALSQGDLQTQSQTTDELILLRLRDQKELRVEMRSAHCVGRCLDTPILSLRLCASLFWAPRTFLISASAIKSSSQPLDGCTSQLSGRLVDIS